MPKKKRPRAAVVESESVVLPKPKIIILFPKEAVFQKDSLDSKENKAFVEKIFSEKLRTNVYVEYKLTDQFSAAEEDEPMVQAALKTFKGKVVGKWHNE